MAAPNGITWGNEVTGSTNNAGKIGIYTSVSSSATSSTVSIEVWYWSKWSISDSTNTYYFNNNATTATTSMGAVAISHTVDTSWSTSNQTKLGSYTYTYNRGASAVSYNCAAKFTGIEKNGEDNVMSATTSYTIPATTATYTVSYNANGGSGAPSSQTKYHGTNLTLSSTKPTRTGYTFQGWGTSATASVATYSAGGTYTSNASVTLYAVWKANTYTVTYHENGATLGSTASNTATYNSNFMTTKNGFIRSGYTFNGWNEKADGTGTVWNLDSPGVYESGTYWNWTYTSNIVLYAQWKAKTIKVTFNKNDNSGETLSQEFTYGVSGNKFGYNTDGTLKWGDNSGQFGNWDRAGYTLLGWGWNSTAISAAFHTYADVTDDFIFTYGNINLYAVWRENVYTVSFDANGGTTSTASKSVIYNSTYGELPIPTREGYEFIGWYTKKTSGTQITSNTTVTITANQTLYAHWKVMNVSYFKSNGDYVLCYTYVKTGGTWKPAIMHKKIDGTYKQSIIN